MRDFSNLSKAELSAALGWSRQKLDRVLERDSDFPVRTRGTQRGGWQFDLPAVIAHLEVQRRRDVDAGEDLRCSSCAQPEDEKADAQQQLF
jgi:hypothetical protein